MLNITGEWLYQEFNTFAINLELNIDKQQCVQKCTTAKKYHKICFHKNTYLRLLLWFLGKEKHV